MSSSFITNNSEAANFLLYKMKINKRKIVNIPNIADLETFFPLKKEEINKKRTILWGDQNQQLFIFGIFGSYRWNKNHDIVIEAIRLLRGKNLLSNISIECFGDKECNGSLYYKLKGYLSLLSLTNLRKLRQKMVLRLRLVTIICAIFTKYRFLF